MKHFILICLIINFKESLCQNNLAKTSIFDKIEVGQGKISHIIFDDAIDYMNVGSQSVICEKAEGKENILTMKAKLPFKETNLLVITKSKKAYNIIVNYSENPECLTLQVTNKSKEAGFYTTTQVKEAAIKAEEKEIILAKASRNISKTTDLETGQQQENVRVADKGEEKGKTIDKEIQAGVVMEKEISLVKENTEDTKLENGRNTKHQAALKEVINFQQEIPCGDEKGLVRFSVKNLVFTDSLGLLTLVINNRSNEDYTLAEQSFELLGKGKENFSKEIIPLDIIMSAGKLVKSKTTESYTVIFAQNELTGKGIKIKIIENTTQKGRNASFLLPIKFATNI